MDAYKKIDKELYENIPNITIEKLIKRKGVYDRVLHRDVASIFDPDS